MANTQYQSAVLALGALAIVGSLTLGAVSYFNPHSNRTACLIEVFTQKAKEAPLVTGGGISKVEVIWNEDQITACQTQKANMSLAGGVALAFAGGVGVALLARRMRQNGSHPQTPPSTRPA